MTSRQLVCFCCRLHFTAGYSEQLAELADVYNDERPRMPFLMWLVRSHDVKPCLPALPVRLACTTLAVRKARPAFIVLSCHMRNRLTGG